jgi:hypothetical protein
METVLMMEVEQGGRKNTKIKVSECGYLGALKRRLEKKSWEETMNRVRR